eukprot:6182188-Pleurochrysis_carterae.AAC.2
MAAVSTATVAAAAAAGAAAAYLVHRLMRAQTPSAPPEKPVPALTGVQRNRYCMHMCNLCIRFISRAVCDVCCGAM